MRGAFSRLRACPRPSLRLFTLQKDDIVSINLPDSFGSVVLIIQIDGFVHVAKATAYRRRATCQQYQDRVEFPALCEQLTDFRF